MEMSASFDILQPSASSGSGAPARGSAISRPRQMRRKVSPLFLFADPWHSSAMPWMISATWFTNVMTLDWSTSVATLKFWILAWPMTHSTRWPGSITFTPAVEPSMFFRMISAPASPNPSTRSEPSLMIVFSRTTVSMGSWLSLPWHAMKFFICDRRFALSISKKLKRPRGATPSAISLFLAAFTSLANFSSAILAALSGLMRMASTFAIMASTGYSTSWLTSLWNIIAAPHSTTQMKAVIPRLEAASTRTNRRWSNQKLKWMSLNSPLVMSLG
mmetsp:Transcript_80543/g.228169  ORF Transcript_80543/g.228169 Transcript_80543/m.228169 type:complete len:274 (+) Transcript_80543:943-1764(+)